MLHIEQLIGSYGATRAIFTGTDGKSVDLQGPGGGLVAAVDGQGSGPLAGALGQGETLTRDDTG